MKSCSPADITKIKQSVFPHELCCLYLGGSRAFGYNLGSSDWDYFGWYLPNSENILSTIGIKGCDGHIFSLYSMLTEKIIGIEKIASLLGNKFLYKNWVIDCILEHKNLLLGKEEIYKLALERIKTLELTRTPKYRAKYANLCFLTTDILDGKNIVLNGHARTLSRIRTEDGFSNGNEWENFKNILKEDMRRAYLNSQLNGYSDMDSLKEIILDMRKENNV